NLQATRLQDGGVLLLGIHHEDRPRQAVHVANAAERAAEALELVLELLGFLLGQPLELAALPSLLKLLHVLYARLDGREVGEHAAEPALVNAALAAALGLFLDGGLGLLFRADEEDGLVVRRQVRDKATGLVEALDGLREVEDVDAVADDRLARILV